MTSTRRLSLSFRWRRRRDRWHLGLDGKCWDNTCATHHVLSWTHCGPEFVLSGASCDTTLRRECSANDGSHDHLVTP